MVSHDETDVLDLEPAGEGTYTQIDDETGEIQIILTEENPNLNAGGVNNDALTDIGPVFTVKNILEQQSNATVWISHDSDAVEFYVPGEGTVESQADGVFMQPGDSETIAMRVDTRETDEITLDSINVMAVLDPEVETGSSGGDGDYQFSSVGDSGDDDDSGTETPDSTETDTETESTPESSGTATPTLGQSQSTPTPTVASTPTPTDDPTGEEAGLDPSSLLWLLVALAALLLLFALARRRRSEE
ncbi:hypothetical protein [Natronomonas gomsonensis]|uniref:hypothetical protein n=1 Tax=Natronomonas gomsonensis TaxID=1046043 RepID=UPI0015B86603|nr:hypothetical protein [Natronomonas gomsonensis]